MWFQAVEEELAQRRREVESVQSEVDALSEERRGGEPPRLAQPPPDKLSARWHRLSARLAGADAPPDALARLDVSDIMFSHDLTLFETNLQRLLDVVVEVRAELQAPVLQGQDYDDFSRQDDKLKVSDRR